MKLNQREDRIDITIRLPKNVELATDGGIAIGGHAVALSGRTVTITPGEDAAAIESVLADVLLRTIGSDDAAWARTLQTLLVERMGDSAFMQVDGPTLSAPGWVDRYVFAGDLSHRLLFERRLAGRPERPVLFVMGVTGTVDLCQNEDGTLAEAPQRQALKQLLAPTRRWMADRTVGAVDGLALVNLSTARVGPTEPRGAYVPPTSDNLAIANRFVLGAAKSAAVCVGAWGAVQDEFTANRMVSQLDGAGTPVHGLVTMRTGREVRWLSADRPRQPRKPRGLATQSRPVPLVDLLSDSTIPLP